MFLYHDIPQGLVVKKSAWTEIESHGKEEKRRQLQKGEVEDHIKDEGSYPKENFILRPARLGI